MRPLCLTLKGFLGIRSGQAKNELTIDFTSIVPADAQMVAVTGPNGAGKTTLIDNMHPFRVMPSRSASPTPSSFSYYDHIVDSTDGALKDLTWEHGGMKYQSVIRMRLTGKTRKQEAYLFEIGSDGQSKPYCNANTGLTSDGKAEVYDRCVEDVLGKPEVFFAAIFSAQNKKPVQTMTATEVKTLLASMLGMDGVKALGEKSSEVQKAIKLMLTGIQSDIVSLANAGSQQKIAVESANVIRGEIVSLSATLAIAKVAVEQAVSEFAVAKGNRVQQASLIAQRASLQSSLDGAQENMTKQLAAFDNGKQASVIAAQKAVDDAKRRLIAAQTAINELNRQVEGGKSLLAQENAVKQVVATKDAKRTVLSSKRASIEDLAFNVAKLNEVRESLSDLQSQLSKDAESGKFLKAEIESISVIADLVDKVPCSSVPGMSQQCQLLENNCRAKTELPLKQVVLQNMRGAYERKSAGAKTMNAELVRLLEAEQRTIALIREVAVLEMDLANIRASEVTLERIEDAKRQSASLQEQNQLAQTQFDNAGADIQTANVNLDVVTNSIKRERKSLEDALKAGVTSAQQSLASLPTPVNESDIAAFESKVEAERKKLGDIEALFGELQSRVAELDAKAIRLEEQVKKLESLTNRKTQVENELSQWFLLSQALSTNGIIAMTIDDAGPQISAICNSLLDECYGGRFVVRLSTQVETATGIQKESFEIHVEDTLRGESKLLGDMSGGEKVWINECLVRAIALHMGQSASIGFQTLFSDESDGPLDETRKRQFMDMKRAVLKRGGYQREYLITQTPALWEMCDAVINVADL